MDRRGEFSALLRQYAQALLGDDLIAYHRGHVTIVDRLGLERASCECYKIASALVNGVTGERGR
jgi:hypothetical protein